MREKIKRVKSKCNCINLRRASNAITEYYDNIMKPSGLTVNQFCLLRNLKRLGVCSTSELAEYVGLERTTLVRTISPLFQKNYVEDISPEGSRNRQIQVTPQGIQALEISIPLWEKAQKAVELKLGSKNLKLLIKFLEKIEEL